MFEQEQPFILQENFNEQQGEADATAYSGDVSVLNSEDPSHEDGIDAESKAFAKAEIDQEASQENSNGIGENTIQENTSAQYADADAEAYSGEVNVNKSGSLSADGDGIDAESKAVAIAKVDQDLDQTNSNDSNVSGSGGEFGQSQSLEQTNNNGGVEDTG